MPDLVLIVDDEDGIRFGIGRFLMAQGYQVIEARGLREAKDAFQKYRPAAVICDYALPDGNALELLPSLRALDESVPVVILTGYGTIDLAVRAIQEGASQFLTKPVDMPSLGVLLARLGEIRRLRQRAVASAAQEVRAGVDPFVGTGEVIVRVREEAQRALLSDSPVLIRGETGTGKGVLAAWIHGKSARSAEAFVDLNCAGLGTELLESELFGHEKGAFTGAVVAKKGLFDLAHRGTFFLDEIADMPAHVQPKLLKVIEEKKYRRLGDVREHLVDARMIFATHQDLEAAMKNGTFRADLYYRIGVVLITLPPLRERVEDIPALVASLLKQSLQPLCPRGECRLSADGLQALQRYAWPGNIRELRNVLERALLRDPNGVLDARAFDLAAPAATRAESSAMPLASLSEIEQQHVGRVYRHANGDVDQSAQILGISRSSMYNLIKRFGLRRKGALNE